jgi:uncharacterized protein (DUF488 family)
LLPILTTGHSTRTIDAFLRLLTAHDVKRLVDVRTIPQSRRYPHFGKERLAEALASASIAYTHMPGLGGLRKPRRDSTNMAWRNESFRGYADYMQTPAFEESLDELIRLGQAERVAIMCAEAVPWRCHRSLIADALLARGVAVEEIASERATRPHRLSSWARVTDGRVSYPGVTGST